MYYIQIMCRSGVDLPESIEPNDISLGFYGFHEIPHIGETIEILGTGIYKIKNIKHTFCKKTINNESAEKVYLMTIYV